MSAHDKPKFQHDCDACAFLGHFAGHDVYTCKGRRDSSLLARYGDDGPEYHSTDLESFCRFVEGNMRVRDHTVTPPVVREAQPQPYHVAWLMALSHEYLKEQLP